MNIRSTLGAALAVLVLGLACTAPSGDTAHAAAPAAGTSGVMADPRNNDAVITTTIQARYFASTDVKGHDIDVDTRDGVVTLKGRVQNERAHREAVRLARSVEGVRSVNDRLALANTVNTRATTNTERRNPSWITSKIQAQYYVHPALKPWHIDVATSPTGVVTLTGRVDTRADHDEAVRIAKNTDGVVDVRDRLTDGTATADSRPGMMDRAKSEADRGMAAADDGWITAKIQSKFFVDRDVKGRDIDVETNRGVVTLRGVVHTPGEHERAIAIVRSTDGVRDVRDELRMESHPVSTSGSYGEPPATQRVDDGWITMKIQSKYFVDRTIHGSSIDVDTRNGIVTLNGTIHSGAEKQQAERLARDTDGVNRVVDRLRVQ